MSKKDFINLIKEEILFLEKERICDYDPKYIKVHSILPLSKLGRAISEQKARIDVLKKILIKLEKNG